MPKWSTQSTQNDLSRWSDDPTIRRRSRVWHWVVLGIVVTLAAAAAIGARPAYRKFRNWRMDQQITQAAAALSRSDWQTARDLSKTVLMDRGGDFEAFRVFTRAQIELKDPGAYILALRLLSHPMSTGDERLLARTYLVDEAPQAIAFSILLGLSKEDQERPENQLLFARLLNARGMSREALSLLEQAPALHTSTGLQLETIRALANFPTPDHIHRARGMMIRLLDAAAPQALEAVALLGNLPGGLKAGPDLADLPEKIAAIPGAQTIHHLHALHPALETAGEAEKEAIFQGAIDRFLASDPATLGTWLVRHGKGARVIDLLEEPSKTSDQAFIARIHAFVREGRFDDALKTFAEVPEGADMVDIHIARAVVERSRGAESAEKAAWNRAFHTATFSSGRNRFIDIARHASVLGARSAAIDAWAGAARVGSGPLPLSEDILYVFKALSDENRSEELFAISRSIARFEPSNPSLINNINYLGVLHGVVSPAAATDALRKLSDTYPSVAAVKSSLALALLAGNDAEAALPLIREIENAEGVQPMMHRALLATALIMTGRQDEGKALLDQVVWSSLMRQEAFRLRDLLIRTHVRDLPLPEANTELFETDPDSVPAWKKALKALEERQTLEELPPLPTPVPYEGKDFPQK